MKKILICSVFLLITLMGCSSNSNEDLIDVSLMLDYTPNTNHSGIYAALNNGYYEDEGINLKILTPGEANVETMVYTNEVDFGISYEENLLMANDNGTDLTSIYAILSHNTSGLMSHPEKGINTPKDLENKTYCGWGSDIEKNLISNLAIQNNVDPETITFAIAQSNFINSTPNDECDFYWEYEAWAGVSAMQNDIKYNYISFYDNGFDEYTPIIVAKKEFIENNYDLVQSFISATIKGYEFAYNNPKETSEIFIKYNPEYDIEFINDSQLYINNYYKDGDKFGYHYANIWNDFSNYLLNEDIITSNDKGDYTNEFIDNYYESIN